MTLHILYRFWNAEDVLLYVGITCNPAKRLERHKGEKPWWNEIASITMEHFTDRASLREAERAAIETEEPLYNIRHAPPRRTCSLVWICDVCQEPIEDDRGYITLSYADLGRYRRGVKAFDERIAEKYPGPLKCYPISELLHHYPELAHWRVLHRKCDPNLQSDDYWISVERIRTAAELVHWCAHMLGKNWIQDTTWTEILHQAEAQLREAA